MNALITGLHDPPLSEYLQPNKFLIPNFTLKALGPLHFPFPPFLPLHPEKSSLTCNLISNLRQISKKCLSEPFKRYHIMWEKVDAIIIADFIGK